jgi:hypothetical protein
MTNLTLALKRTKSEAEHRCGVCGATFAPIEDSGCRILTVKVAEQEPLTAAMCGGCHSKWAGGSTVTLRAAAAPATA